MAAFIIYIIRWAVCLTLLYSLFGLFMKRETLHGINRIVLLFVLTSSMVLPFVQVSTKETNIVTQGREMIEYQITHAQNPLSEDAERIPPENPDNGVTYHALPISEEVNAYILIAVAIYLAGLFICWLRYFWQIAALLLMIHRSTRIKIAGVPSYVHVVTSPSVKAPCSWMRWIILNPADVNTRAIIKHELAHIRLGHSWDMLLCELTCRMLWFLPFAWMLRQDLRDVHEYQADRCVLQGGIRDEEYQLLLIKKATSTGLQPVVNAFNQSPIKRRFKMMYRKPSRRWVALKATYLLPLSALAVVAFARPRGLSEIEEKVETTSPTVTDFIKTVAQQLPFEPCPYGEGLGSVTSLTANKENANPTPDPSPTWEGNGSAELPDSNLVKADLAESGPSVLGGSAAKSAAELLDSTMQAVGARKIAEGTYIGHFQPSLNNDTVRIARATILDRKNQQTDEHLFAQNAAAPYAYNITLHAETRKDRKGYYIRYLQPVSSKLRNYDKKAIDPKMLSTDSVLTKRRSKHLIPHTPIAMSQTKKEARIFMYLWLGKNSDVDALIKQNYNFYHNLAIVDEKTGDQYVCRSVDYSYFKYVKDDTAGNDTVKVYQACLVFPPFGKRVDQVYFDNISSEYVAYDTFFSLSKIPRKGRVITQ